MTKDNQFNLGYVIGYLVAENAAQCKLIETQQKVIELQEQVRAMTPTLPDEDVQWHTYSGGLISEESAKSKDPEMVREFYNWILAFGKKYVQPFVSPKVYMEVMNQMTRGLTGRLAEIETVEKLGITAEELETAKKEATTSEKEVPLVQVSLLQ